MGDPRAAVLHDCRAIILGAVAESIDIRNVSTHKYSIQIM